MNRIFFSRKDAKTQIVRGIADSDRDFIFRAAAKIITAACILFASTGDPALSQNAKGPYKASWNSLKKISTPQWLRDGKFGIYTHWGVYAVPAQGPNATWYANQVYVNADSPQRKYHEATYGKLENFGYKDFIPMFTGEKFNAEEWSDLFEKAGARFAGPVAEHHDGFSMWDTKYNEWNASKMGPKRDVVGELSKAIKSHNMKFVTAFHHAEQWFYFPTWDKRYDCGDPRYSGLYGPIHEKGALPDRAFLDQWKGKIVEVINAYEPDFIWFDIDNLVDRVSKNGYLLLNVGPKPDGSIPDEARDRLLEMGRWLKINGEAIYGTTAWVTPGEGPSRLERSGDFNEKNDLVYTSQDVRFTVKDNNLYATVLAWPEGKLVIKSLAAQGSTWAGLYPSEIASVTMLGDGKELKWAITKEGMTIEMPASKPCDYAYVIRIVRKRPF